VPAYVALLRAVNVGGRSLSMERLRALAERAGFSEVRTYIQSGNLLFSSRLAEAKVKARLEAALAAELGMPVSVLVRSAAEIAEVARKNPFPKRAPNRVVAIFLERPAPKTALRDLVAPGGEEVRLSGREIFVHYPNGQGRSKLKLAAAAFGTARNLNTVAKLAELLREA
jgi:uncharacterized protein (DUF1697 family)